MPPSLNPTLDPTLDPTIRPTTPPTLDPTLHPSLLPTVEPTRNPTLVPTGHPSTSRPTVVPTSTPTFMPSQSPTNCCGQLEIAEETCNKRITEIIDTCSYDDNPVCQGGTLISCDGCQRDDLSDLMQQMEQINGNITSIETCQQTANDAVSAANAVETDIENLIAALLVEDTEKWQKVFDDFSTGCTYIPTQYCEVMQTSQGSQTPACTLDNGVCKDL